MKIINEWLQILLKILFKEMTPKITIFSLSLFSRYARRGLQVSLTCSIFNLRECNRIFDRPIGKVTKNIAEVLLQKYCRSTFHDLTISKKMITLYNSHPNSTLKPQVQAIFFCLTTTVHVTLSSSYWQWNEINIFLFALCLRFNFIRIQ